MSDAGYAIVVLHPPTDPKRADFSSKEVDSTEAVHEALQELFDTVPLDQWRMIHVLHIEDLPLFMEGPKPPELVGLTELEVVAGLDFLSPEIDPFQVKRVVVRRLYEEGLVIARRPGPEDV